MPSEHKLIDCAEKLTEEQEALHPSAATLAAAADS